MKMKYQVTPPVQPAEGLAPPTLETVVAVVVAVLAIPLAVAVVLGIHTMLVPGLVPMVTT
jgi:hypothetical protein